MNTFDLTGTTAAGTAWYVRGNRTDVAARFGRFFVSASFGRGRSLAEIASTVRVSTEVVK
ncbi:hypothetical protein FGG30_gp080 [Mycobacterium phage Pixie]|uniref:Uncharacterized protein n=2 Tax=Keshuvirus pixie TaxID=1034114 RepID=G1D4Y9_9CAUD|nr:hypothetical protein FGG30_gp080 [Mycobacterium phage Pixie]AEK09890.1 hypothetical protein PBI_PIXIE_80 [Mycobacterium phage Pixie]AOT23816.1 hypothetical protein SEA_TBOND007_77 [Mycobacterium phage TBond007]WNM69021.1 hypothetical protein SEA_TRIBLETROUBLE_80 [Mycobacterium Phage TribleTrouble]